MKKQISFRPAAPDELQIDLDRPRARIPARLLRLVAEHWPIWSVRYSRSKSGNTHVTIKLLMVKRKCPLEPENWKGPERYCTCQDDKPPDVMEKLFLQAVLGSDPVRELLSWGRARNGCPYPTLFFEKEKT